MNYYASTPDQAFIPPTALGVELLIIAALVAYAGGCLKFVYQVYDLYCIMTTRIKVKLQILVDSVMEYLFYRCVH